MVCLAGIWYNLLYGLSRLAVITNVSDSSHLVYCVQVKSQHSYFYTVSLALFSKMDFRRLSVFVLHQHQCSNYTVGDTSLEN